MWPIPREGCCSGPAAVREPQRRRARVRAGRLPLRRVRRRRGGPTPRQRPEHEPLLGKILRIDPDPRAAPSTRRRRTTRSSDRRRRRDLGLRPAESLAVQLRPATGDLCRRRGPGPSRSRPDRARRQLRLGLWEGSRCADLGRGGAIGGVRVPDRGLRERRRPFFDDRRLRVSGPAGNLPVGS